MSSSQGSQQKKQPDRMGPGSAQESDVQLRGRYCPIELATEENTLFELPPINRIVPTTSTRITASMTAYSAMSWPSSLDHRLRKVWIFIPSPFSLLMGEPSLLPALQKYKWQVIFYAGNARHEAAVVPQVTVAVVGNRLFCLTGFEGSLDSDPGFLRLEECISLPPDATRAIGRSYRLL
jgi:hypothetical protein